MAPQAIEGLRLIGNVERIFVNCPLCKWNRPKYFFSDELIRIVKCEKCGLIYQNPQIPEEVLNKIAYMADYYKYYEKREERQMQFYRNRFKSIFNKLKGGKVLDIGCGTGCFLAVAKEHGLHVYGVDVSPYAKQAVYEKHGINIYTEPIEKIGFKNNEFDFIHMSHVLEHCRDPVSLLVKIRRIIKPGGVLFIEVPNEENFMLKRIAITLVRRLFLNNDPDFQKPYPEHLVFFTRKTIKKVLEVSGWNILNIAVEGFSDHYRFDMCFISNNWKVHLLKAILSTGIDVRLGFGMYIVALATK